MLFLYEAETSDDHRECAVRIGSVAYSERHRARYAIRWRTQGDAHEAKVAGILGNRPEK
jgi:hypothetical protein